MQQQPQKRKGKGRGGREGGRAVMGCDVGVEGVRRDGGLRPMGWNRIE